MAAERSLRRPLRGIVFDKDGTLFDFQRSWSGWTCDLIDHLASGRAELKIGLAHALGANLATRQLSAGSVVIAGTADEVASAILSVPGAADDRATLIEVLLRLGEDVMQVPAAPLRPLLLRFRDMGLKIGVATNDGAGPAQVHLERAGVLDLFDLVLGYDSGFGAKPEPGQLLAFSNGHGFDPAEVLMVGDSLHDLDAARAAGMVPVGVLTGLASAAELAPRAAVVLPDISHLPDWITAAG